MKRHLSNLLGLALCPVVAFSAAGAQADRSNPDSPIPGIGEVSNTVAWADSAAADDADAGTAKADADPVEGTPLRQDVIDFLGGDRLHGRILSIESGAGVQWERADVEGTIQFSTANIDSIRLATLGDGQPHSGMADTRVRLKDGSEFPASLVSVDDATVKVDTWYGGNLEIKRSAVEFIHVVQKSAGILYRGPRGLEEWERQRGNRTGWRFHDGGLVSSDSSWIGRRIEDMPDQVRIDFEMQWAGQLALLVSLMPESLQNYSSGSYTIQLNSGYVYMYRNTQNGNQNLGQTQVTPLRMRNKVRVGIRLDRQAKTVALLVNGALVKQWKETGRWIANGDGLVFYSQGQGAVKVSEIEVAGWDGSLRDGLEGGEPMEADLVTLVNGDKVSGELLGMAEGEITFSASFAPDLKIPMERVAKIEFGGERGEMPAAAPGMVRAIFQGEGSLLIDLKSLSREAIEVTNGSFGGATLDPGAFKALEFNLDRKAEGQDGDVFLGPSDLTFD